MAETVGKNSWRTPLPTGADRGHRRDFIRLSALAVQTISAAGWHADGGGLYLEVDRTGRKRWTMRITVNGKRCDFGLGPIHKVPLQKARERAAEYREKAYAGIYPAARASAAPKLAGHPVPATCLTFESAADEVHRIRKAQWSNGKHVNQWINTLPITLPVYRRVAHRHHHHSRRAQSPFRYLGDKA